MARGAVATLPVLVNAGEGARICLDHLEGVKGGLLPALVLQLGIKIPVVALVEAMLEYQRQVDVGVRTAAAAGVGSPLHGWAPPPTCSWPGGVPVPFDLQGTGWQDGWVDEKAEVEATWKDAHKKARAEAVAKARAEAKKDRETRTKAQQQVTPHRRPSDEERGTRRPSDEEQFAARASGRTSMGSSHSSPLSLRPSLAERAVATTPVAEPLDRDTASRRRSPGGVGGYQAGREDEASTEILETSKNNTKITNSEPIHNYSERAPGDGAAPGRWSRASTAARAKCKSEVEETAGRAAEAKSVAMEEVTRPRVPSRAGSATDGEGIQLLGLDVTRPRLPSKAGSAAEGEDKSAADKVEAQAKVSSPSWTGGPCQDYLQAAQSTRGASWQHLRDVRKPALKVPGSSTRHSAAPRPRGASDPVDARAVGEGDGCRGGSRIAVPIEVPPTASIPLEQPDVFQGPREEAFRMPFEAMGVVLQ